MAQLKIPAAFWQSLVLCIVLAIAFWIAVGLTGYVSGSEFDPVTFQTRTFWYWEVPLVHLQVWPIDRKVTTHDVALMLRSRGDVATAPQTPPGEWDLVEVRHGPASPRRGDAHLLIEQFGVRNGGKFYWETWTADHPVAAATLWPVVVSLVREDLYVLLPHAFDEALQKSSGDLAGRLRRRLIEQADGWAADLRAAGRVEEADGFSSRWANVLRQTLAAS